MADDMRGIGVTTFGGPENLRVVRLPKPRPGAGEVRIRVGAATVNPTDILFRSGKGRRKPEGVPPYIPGMEAAGQVDELGEGTSWKVGDEVMAIALPISHRGGAYADYIVVPSGSVARIPQGLSVPEAATIPMNGLTALLALDRLDLSPGQTLAVTGAAGALGGYVVQLAKARGLKIVADAGPRDEQLVRDLGADHVVPRGDDVADRFREIASGGVDGLVDAAMLHQQVTDAIKNAGSMAVVRGWNGQPGRGITVHHIWVQDYAENAGALEQLVQHVERGELTPRVARTFRAEDVAAAHRQLENGGNRGRIVLEL